MGPSMATGPEEALTPRTGSDVISSLPGTTCPSGLTSESSPSRPRINLPRRASLAPLPTGSAVSSHQESHILPALDEEFNKIVCADLSKKDHDYYFGSYSTFNIHEEMLKDTVRTRTYQRAIENNPQDFKDKIVMDIGCGTGILSIFAARAGAKHVYAIENAEIAHFATEIVKRNGLSDKITVIKGKMEEITLPV